MGTTVPPAVPREDAPTPAAELTVLREKEQTPVPTPAAELKIICEPLKTSARGLPAAPGCRRGRRPARSESAWQHGHSCIGLS